MSDYYYFKTVQEKELENGDTIEETKDLYRIRIENDNEPWNCRTDQDGNVGHMICWNRHYELGDKHEYDDPQDFFKHLLMEKAHMDEYTATEMVEDGTIADTIAYLTENCDCEFLSLNIYDHSGISMYSGDVNDHYDAKWDCSEVGWIYTTKEEILKYRTATEENWREVAKESIEYEVKEYNQYLTGEVYGYILEYFEPDDPDAEYTLDDEDGWTEKDACWGFYSDKYGEELAREIANDSITTQPFIDENEAEEIMQNILYDYQQECEKQEEIEQSIKNKNEVYTAHDYLIENCYSESGYFTRDGLEELADEFVSKFGGKESISEFTAKDADAIIDEVRDFVHHAMETEKFGIVGFTAEDVVRDE